MWKNYFSRENDIKINDIFAIYFNTKLLIWKVSILKENKEKYNICRVCEKRFYSKDFMLHSWFCKEINSCVPEINKFGKKIEILRNDLKKHLEYHLINHIEFLIKTIF